MQNDNNARKRLSGAQRRKNARQHQHQQVVASSENGRKRQWHQTVEALLAARTKARKIVSDKKRAAAEQEYNKALELFNAGSYEAALSILQNACRIVKTELKSIKQLIVVYAKLERLEDAFISARYYLAIQPQNDEPRFLRFLALLLSGHIHSALSELIVVDGGDVYSKDKSLAVILGNAEDVNIDKEPKEGESMLLNDSKEQEEDDDEFFENERELMMVYPNCAPCTANFYLDCPSDTEDFFHEGNGSPCKSYNQGTCHYGKNCFKKHSGDSWSIRDGIGRNVCLFFLFGRCHFVDKPGQCWYSHSRAHLPATGWWNRADYVEFSRRNYDKLKSSGSNEVMDLMLGGDMNGTWLPFEHRERFIKGVGTINKPENVQRASHRG